MADFLTIQRWRSEIYAQGKRIHIGYFDNEVIATSLCVVETGSNDDDHHPRKILLFQIEAAMKYDEYAARMKRPVNFPQNFTGKTPDELPAIVMVRTLCYPVTF
jgi:hypothetical protein